MQSKGGHFFNNEERKDEKLTADITAKMKKLDESIRARGGDLSVEVRSDVLISSLSAYKEYYSSGEEGG